MIALAQRHKLEFVASATIPENLDRCYSSEVQALLAQQPDVLLRETVRDLALCQSFRRDLYAKGGAPLWPAELGDQLQQWRFVAAGLVPRRLARGPIPLRIELDRLDEADRMAWRQLTEKHKGTEHTLTILALYWADGERSVLEIVDLVEMEAGVRDVELVLTFFRLLEKLGWVAL